MPLLFNAGEARIRGFEAEASYRAPWGLMLRRAALSMLDDEIQTITPVPGATATVRAGRRPAADARRSGATSASAYEVALGERVTLTPRFDGSYTSKITFITGSIPLIEEDGYFVGNASHDA